MGFLIFLFLLISIVWCVFIAKKAKGCGMSFGGWFIMSFLFSPIAMTVALFMVINIVKVLKK